jgi:hypothetical protein
VPIPRNLLLPAHRERKQPEAGKGSYSLEVPVFLGLGEPIPGNVPNPNPLGEEVSSVGRSAKRILIKRILIEALVLAVPFVWRKVREYRRGKK